MIQNKQKPCKGTGKAKGSGCGEKTFNRRYGLCTACFSNWLISTPEGAEKLRRATLSGQRRVKKIQSKERRIKKEQDKSIQQLVQEARKPFQVWIRFRDANESCISCGLTISDIWDAGHYKKAEIFSGTIFDERNVHKQCRKCNSFLGGNEAEYRNRLVRKFGEQWVLNLELDANRLRVYSWSREELNDIKTKYRKLMSDKNN